jgi:hypothetical protein
VDGCRAAVTGERVGRADILGKLALERRHLGRNYQLKLFEFEFRFGAPGSLRSGRKLRRLVDERMKAWG